MAIYSFQEAIRRKAEYEQLKQDKRELRRKAAKRKAKERDDIRKQRKLDKLAPRQFKPNDYEPHSINQLRDVLGIGKIPFVFPLPL